MQLLRRSYHGHLSLQLRTTREELAVDGITGPLRGMDIVMAKITGKYNLQYRVIYHSNNLPLVKALLDAKIPVMILKKQHMRKIVHFMVIDRFEHGKFTIKNPNSEYRGSRINLREDAIKRAMKGLYLFPIQFRFFWPLTNDQAVDAESAGNLEEV